MTHLNLPQTCLLEVSGELGAKAKAQLEEHIRKYPAALVEHELIKAQYQMLRSLPTPELTEDQKREIASNIKQGIHRKLRQKEQSVHAAKRWQFIHYALATVSGMAACLVIGGGILAVYNHQVDVQQRAVAEARKADNTIQRFLDADRENLTDKEFQRVSQGIDEANQWQPIVTTDSSRGAAKLLDDINTVTDQAPTSSVEEPGTL